MHFEEIFISLIYSATVVGGLVGFEISLRDFKIDETNSTLLETILLGKDCLWSSECMEKLKKHLQFEETIV